MPVWACMDRSGHAKALHGIPPEPGPTRLSSGPPPVGPSAKGLSAPPDLFGSFVRDIMTRKVVTVAPTDTLRVAATLLTRKDISGMPVVATDGKVVGVLSEKDIVRVLRDKTGFAMPGGLFALILETSEARQKDLLTHCRTVMDEVQVSSAMTTPAKTIPPEMLTLEAARLMISLHINRMPVVEHGKLVGIVSRTNVLTLYHGRE